MTLATEVASLPLVLEPTKPEEKKITFSGSVVMAGKRFAFIRHGKEMHVMGESETIPQTSLALASISTDSANLFDPSGGTLVARGESSDTQGFLKALEALQHPSGLLALPIIGSLTASGSAEPLCYLTDKIYHSRENCGNATGQILRIPSSDLLPAEKAPCQSCWTKDPL